MESTIKIDLYILIVVQRISILKDFQIILINKFSKSKENIKNRFV